VPQLTNVYDSIVNEFATAGKRVDIAHRELESALATHLGVIHPETVERHISMMQTLGYIKLVTGAGVATGSRYDLVGKKIVDARIREKAQELAARQRGEGKRR